jgi:hypothetical protein
MRLPGYADLSEIGTSAFATVYKAVELGTGRPVALKVLRLASTSRRMVYVVNRELGALAFLGDHPNVTTLFRTFSTPTGQPVLVLELCKESFAQRVRNSGPLATAEAVRVGVKIAGALETAHRHGLLHKDMKPQNILVSRSGEPVLADFGIAAIQASAQCAEGALGFTTLHAPPEALESKLLSPAADVYGLASSMYHLLLGKGPFSAREGEAPASVILRILESPAPRPRAASVPAALADLLESSLAKDPARRPQTAAAFAEQLRAIEASAGWPQTAYVVLGSRPGQPPTGPADPHGPLTAEPLGAPPLAHVPAPLGTPKPEPAALAAPAPERSAPGQRLPAPLGTDDPLQQTAQSKVLGWTAPTSAPPTGPRDVRKAGSARSRLAVVCTSVAIVLAAGAVAVARYGSGLASGTTRACRAGQHHAGQHCAAGRAARAGPVTWATPTNTAAHHTAVLLPSGAEGPASAVPWGEVGPGWSVALWAQQANKPGKATLYLVDPVGGRYIVCSFPVPDPLDETLQLADWSGDKHRVLLSQPVSTGQQVTDIDLSTGRAVHRFWPRDLDSVEYTRPDGQALLIGAGRTLRRTDLNGFVEKTYASTFPGAGTYDGLVPPLSTPDGTEHVLETGSGMAVVANGGQLVRALPSPTKLGCYPVRWWRTGVVLASCAWAKSGPYVMNAQLYLMDISGSPPVALTARPASGLVDQDAWAIPPGVYVQQDVTACGGQTVLARLRPDGSTAQVPVPGTTGNVLLIGGYGDELELSASPGCHQLSGNPPPGSLTWFNPVTGHVTVVLGPSMGPALKDGTVLDAIAYQANGGEAGVHQQAFCGC